MGKVFFRKDKINESNRLNEIGDTPEGQFMLGRLKGRQNLRHRGEQTFGKITKTTLPVGKHNDPDFEAGEFFEDPMSWEPPYSHDEIYANGGCDVGKMEYNDEMYDFEEFIANELFNSVRKKLQSASFLKRQPELKPEVDRILKDIQQSLNKTNESYFYSPSGYKMNGCIIDDGVDLEEIYQKYANKLNKSRHKIDARIEYRMSTDKKFILSVPSDVDEQLVLDVLYGGAPTTKCKYTFQTSVIRGNRLYMTFIK